MKKSGKLKSRALKSAGFKSVTFNVQKTLNDSHSVMIHVNSTHYFPGDTVSGYVYLNFSEKMPSESLDLLISGYEETSFTMKVHPDEREEAGIHKHFGKKLHLLVAEDGFIKAGEHVFPFQFLLPGDIPASMIYQDSYCSAAIKYEISVSMISTNKEIMDDLLSKKQLNVFEKKKIQDFSKMVLEKRVETCADSKIMGPKEKLLGNESFKAMNEEIDDTGNKMEFYEFPVTFKTFCCFKEGSLLLSFLLKSPTLTIGEPFQLINKLRGNIYLEFIHYAFYREVKCESAEKKHYHNKTKIEAEEVSHFPKTDIMTVKANFHFKGHLDIKVSRMPTTHGSLINCFYYLFVSAKVKGICGNMETFRIPVHVSGELSSVTKDEIENICFDEEFKNISHPLKVIVLK